MRVSISMTPRVSDATVTAPATCFLVAPARLTMGSIAVSARRATSPSTVLISANHVRRDVRPVARRSAPVGAMRR